MCSARTSSCPRVLVLLHGPGFIDLTNVVDFSTVCIGILYWYKKETGMIYTTRGLEYLPILSFDVVARAFHDYAIYDL